MRRLRNVTITLDESVARWARLEAARENTSVSRFLGSLLEERMRQGQEYEAAMNRYLSIKPRDISSGLQYPRRDDLHDRATLR